MIEPPTLAAVLRAARGAPPDPDVDARLRSALAGAGSATPWYLRVLIGVGAWFGTLFLLGFLFLLLDDVFRDPAVPAIGIGLPLVAGGVALHRLRGDFARQLALVLSLSGQGLFVFALGGLFNSDELGALAALALSLVLLTLYPDRVHRFFSTLIAIGAVGYLLEDARVALGADLLAVALVFLLTALWRLLPADLRGRHGDFLDAAGAGTVVALAALVAAAAFNRIEAGGSDWLEVGALTSLGASAALLAAMASLAAEHRLELTDPVPLAAGIGVVLVAALTLHAPGVPVTLLIMLLAFDRRHLPALGVGGAFFLVSVALYYYDLELTLLRKSGVLLGSGAVCLGAWAALRAHLRRPA